MMSSPGYQAGSETVHLHFIFFQSNSASMNLFLWCIAHGTPELFMVSSLKHLHLHNTQGSMRCIVAFDPVVHVKQFNTDVAAGEVQQQGRLPVSRGKLMIMFVQL